MASSDTPVEEATDEVAPSSARVRPPFVFAKRNGVLVTEDDRGDTILVYRDDVTLSAINELRRFCNRPMRLKHIGNEQFETMLVQAYEHDSAETQQMMEDIGEDLDLGSIAAGLAEPEDLLESEDDAPIIRLINALLTEAVKANASDIHIEPFESRLSIRMRVDGIMREILQPRAMLAPLIVSRIKVMSKLDIAEKRLPQDGRISLKVAGRAVDLRVSTLPASQGERVVLRLLDKQAGRLNLDHLGMAKPSQDVIDHLIHRPHGIILVTGPTGSGKTTTLYAALTRLNDKSRNIMTIEDPIEYFIDGIGQTQVNVKVELTFARGLRAILRQDPDVVMIGEIRDLETAEIAVQSSLTGHLVLSTLHTNTAVGAVTRLRDMGVEPFLLASSLIGVLAQRLVRVLCEECKEPYKANAVDCEKLGLEKDADVTLYHSGSCSKCSHSGYSGRTGIYELVPVDDTMREMIHDGAAEQALERYARSVSPSIGDDGKRRVLDGHTTLEEVLRVTQAS